MPDTDSPTSASHLTLLLRVNAVQAWRRLKSVRTESRLLSFVIGLFIVGYLVVSFYLFHRGLRFIESFPGLGSLLTERLIYLLFAFLFVLLLFSNLVISYTNLFRNRETMFLLTLPVERQTVFRWKLCESTLLASWAFLFLIAPLLAAYGLTHKTAWHFYVITLVLTGMFIVLPAVIGAWLAVTLARHMDRRAFQVSLAGLAVVLLAASFVWLRPEPVTDEMLETRVLSVLDRLLMKTRFAQFPFLPSYWLSSAVLQWAERSVAGAVFFILVLASYVLFFGALALTRMGRLFYDASSTVHSRGSVFARWNWFRRREARREQFGWEPGLLDRAVLHLPFVRGDTAALAVKDMRAFWRDTTQWGQTLVLFGLLGAYIINLRHFSQQLTNPFWVTLVSYLNLGACSLNLATLTTRFVYPQFSLEGKRLWIVGLAPLGLAKVVKVKYALASTASLLVTLSLICLSCRMLKLPLLTTLYFAITITIMTFTLNGLAIGLGALYPNFKEDNPSKIVSGFGGTFCLVLSFLYIVGSVVLLAVGSRWTAMHAASWSPMGASWICFIVMSLLFGWLPMHLALRRLAHFEL